MSVPTSPTLGAAVPVPVLCIVLLVNLWLAQCLQSASTVSVFSGLSKSIWQAVLHLRVALVHVVVAVCQLV